MGDFSTTNPRKLTITMLVVLTLLSVSLFTQVAHASSKSGNFNVHISTENVLRIRDGSSGAVVSFQAKTSDWNASCSLSTTDAGGTLIVTPLDSGSLFVTANYGNVSIKVNGVEPLGAYPYATGSSFTVTWSIPAGTGPVLLPTLNVKGLLQFLLEGDLLGFLQALFLFSWSSADLFYGVLAMVFCIPIYIRTKSLVFLCIIWIILGSFFLALMPIVSPLAVLFMGLGIGTLIFKLIRSRNS